MKVMQMFEFASAEQELKHKKQNNLWKNHNQE